MATTTRKTNLPLPRSEMYYYDENASVYKPMADSDGMMPIQSIQKKWKDSFSMPSNALNTNNWDLIQTGTGHSITVANGELNIATGITASTETILQTKETFSDPFRALFGFKATQKIANQELIMEAISVDPVTGNPDGLHSVAWRVGGNDSLTNTNAVYVTQNGGLTPLSSPVVGTINAQSAYSILELELFADEVWYHTRPMDSANGRGASWVRHQQIPDPNATFKVRIRVRNLATAPASTTTYSFQFVTVVDYAELTAEITAGRGNTAQGQGLYATVTGSVGINNVRTDWGVNLQSNTAIYTDTTTILGASGLYTGTVRDLGTTLGFNRFRVTVGHTAGLGHGHMYFQQSHDNITWRETHRVPVPSDGQYRTFEFPTNNRYVRIMFQNGATAQTMMYLGTALVRVDGVFDMDKTITFQVANTALAASASVAGITNNLGSNHSFNRHRASVFADQAGTLYFEQSRDGSIWRVTKTVAVNANTNVIDEDLIVHQYARVRFVNGATANTVFELANALIRQ